MAQPQGTTPSGGTTQGTTGTTTGSGFDWNNLVTGVFSFGQYIPGMIAASKGGQVPNYGAPAPDPAAQDKTWLYIMLAIVAFIIIVVIGIVIYKNRENKG